MRSYRKFGSLLKVSAKTASKRKTIVTMKSRLYHVITSIAEHVIMLL